MAARQRALAAKPLHRQLGETQVLPSNGDQDLARRFHLAGAVRPCTHRTGGADLSVVVVVVVLFAVLLSSRGRSGYGHQENTARESSWKSLHTVGCLLCITMAIIAPALRCVWVPPKL
jgi:hypothetical protein